MNKTNTICNNCGKSGHMFSQCKMPIISYGIVLFRKGQKGIEYLMIRRKDTFGYIDFIRGKYSPYNISQVNGIVNEMTNYEKHNILNESFTDLWNKMWGGITNNQYKIEENMSAKKLEIIRSGLNINDVTYDLKTIIDNSESNWDEPEWEFPKGRRNSKEKDLDCALREFEEETGLLKENIIVIENVIPFEEIFLGTNRKSYKHKYFLAYMKNDFVDMPLNNYQITEVSKLEWKTLEECLLSIRPYNLEKKQLIININKMLEEYSLYS